MDNLSSAHRQAVERERYEILQQVEDWLDAPMLVFSGFWLALFVIELIWGLTPLLDALGMIIWIIFGLDFALEFFLAPRKLPYLKRNWLSVVSLLLPALRLFRFVRFLRVLQGSQGTRGIRLLRILTRTNRGMRTLANSFTRRGFGYLLGLTTIVIFLGAAGMYAFENEVADSPLDDYGTALWWTAMTITTMGSDYFPKTPEGRILCFLLALYGFAIFGYVSASLATFFVGRDAENPEAEVAGAQAITQLQSEIAALRLEIQALLPTNND